jgi:hypothetical protein
MKTALFIGTALLLFAAAAMGENPPNRYWVFLKDRSIELGQQTLALQNAEAALTVRNRARRMKSMLSPVDETDLPVAPAYLAQLRQTGVKIRTASRYLNAVSLEANPDKLNALRSLPFVDRIEAFRSKPIRLDIAPRRARPTLDDLHYGLSYQQNQLCHVPALHDRGLSGRGVMICFLDSGFRLSHQAFDSLHVTATYDFIQGDTIVANQAGQDSSNQDTHGTGVLSTATGYRDGVLIGPAYGATLLCAKTEWVSSETMIEEDYYVAGLEWADSLGADITSSSLGYIDWYTFEQMDGQSAITTRGVQIAVRHGILCITSAGNERTAAWGHIVAPADADSILAVGSVDSSGVFISSFSSPGPTADGRIKPDVCAMGEWVFCAQSDSTDQNYFYLFGTSLSTPTVAGTAALIMEAHPTWTAQQVRTAILQTASRAAHPNNDFGWGIVNGLAAADYILSAPDKPGTPLPGNPVLLTSYPNPVNGTATLTLTVPAATDGKLILYDILGREEYRWTTTRWSAGRHTLLLASDNLTTGTHFARFAGTSGSAVTRIVVLK